MTSNDIKTATTIIPALMPVVQDAVKAVQGAVPSDTAGADKKALAAAIVSAALPALASSNTALATVAANPAVDAAVGSLVEEVVSLLIDAAVSFFKRVLDPLFHKIGEALGIADAPSDPTMQGG